jgi:hypothetical protein
MARNDIEARRRLRQREADAEYAQRCADTVQGTSIEDLANSVWLDDKLCRLPPEKFDPILTYANTHEIPFEDAIVELVLKGLESWLEAEQ